MSGYDSILVENEDGTVRTRWFTPYEAIRQLQEDCEYDPEGDSTIDALIDYKDALEDYACALLDQLGREQREATA